MNTIIAGSAWEEHSHLCQLPCECGGEIHPFEVKKLTHTTSSVIERVTGECNSCLKHRSMDFDLTAYFKNADSKSLRIEEAWPAPAGFPYPMAEQKLPNFEAVIPKTFSLTGRWQIIGGRAGSMGAAYFCVDSSTSPGQFAVCKAPLEISANEAHINECNFYQAFSWGTGKRSSHVLDLYDVQGTGIGAPLLVLQAILPGPKGAITVADWIESGLVTADLATAWTAHVATGLLHCRNIVPGFVHGDLKPDNLLIDFGWLCKLSDFGMSGTKESPATPGAFLYRAPELWNGEPCSEKSDVYSLGVIAYEMFCGKIPYFFDGDDFETAARVHCNQKPREDNRVPAEIIRCLSKLPEDRPSLEDIIAAFPHPSTRATMTTSEFIIEEKIKCAAAQINMGNPGAAIVILYPLIQTEHEGVLSNLAIAFSKSGNQKAADNTYALLADKINLSESEVYAAHLHRFGHSTTALPIAIAAINANPRSVAARITASAILNDLGDFNQALDQITEAKKLDPGHPAVLYQLAFTCIKLKKLSAAKDAMDRLSKITGVTDLTRSLSDLGHNLAPKIFKKST